MRKSTFFSVSIFYYSILGLAITACVPDEPGLCRLENPSAAVWKKLSEGILSRPRTFESVSAFTTGLGHTNPGGTEYFSDDGRFALTTDTAGYLIVWDLERQTEEIKVRPFRGPSDIAVLRSDLTEIILCDRESQSIAAIKLRTGTESWRTRIGVNTTCAAISPDDRFFALGTDDGRIIIITTRDGRVIRETGQRLNGDRYDQYADRKYRTLIRTLVFSGNGTTIFAGRNDGTVQMYDAETGGTRGDYSVFTSPVSAIAIAEDRKQAAFGSDTGKIVLTDIGSGAAREFDVGSSVSTLAFSLEGDELFASDESCAITRWNLFDSEDRETIRAEIEKVAGQPSRRKIFLSRRGEKAFIVDLGGWRREIDTIAAWDYAGAGTAAEIVVRGSANLECAYFLQGNEAVYVGGRDGSVVRRNLDSGAAAVIIPGNRNGITIRELLRAPKGAKTIALDLLDRFLVVEDGSDAAPKTISATGLKRSITSCVFSHDARIAFSAGFSEDVAIWDLEKGRLRSILRTDSAVVRSLCLSLDGTRLGVGAEDGTTTVWAVPSLRLIDRFIPEFDVDRSSVEAVVFSPDGTTLVSGLADGRIIYRSIDTRNTRKLAAYPSSISRIAFSPDSRLMIVGHMNGLIEVIDSANGNLIKRFNGGERAIVALSFSKDKPIVYSASWDGTVCEWNLETGIRSGFFFFSSEKQAGRDRTFEGLRKKREKSYDLDEKKSWSGH